MPNKIDYAFISAREGGSTVTAYVPASNVSQSGATIATGFDLGQRDEADLKNLGLSLDLIKKLKPYLKITGKDARSVLQKKPLSISSSQATEIDKAVKKKDLNNLSIRYSRALDNSKKIAFFSLPTQAQTVIASVSFQYGDLAVRAPKFWKAVAAQDWKDAVSILENFRDAYPSRRKLEASLLKGIAQ